ncbi:hypothetical protein CapIbe_020012 [Capra ibex]
MTRGNRTVSCLEKHWCRPVSTIKANLHSDGASWWSCVQAITHPQEKSDLLEEQGTGTSQHETYFCLKDTVNQIQQH